MDENHNARATATNHEFTWVFPVSQDGKKQLIRKKEHNQYPYQKDIIAQWLHSDTLLNA